MAWRSSGGESASIMAGMAAAWRVLGSIMNVDGCVVNALALTRYCVVASRTFAAM
jgi:hypothetical protein